MADTKKPIDPHLLSSTFPEPSAIFTFRPEPLEAVKASAIFVLDTSALLVPYRTGRNSLEAIRNTYAVLVKENRLAVPAQAAREFAHQRAEHLKNIYKQFSDRRSISVKAEPWPFFEGLKEYAELQRIEKEAENKLEEYRKAVSGLLDVVRGWLWNDPVSGLYSELLGRVDVIVEPAGEKGDLVKEAEYRYENRVPPGFKDEKKPDGGIGDFLIWKSVLRIGSDSKTHVVYVSGDEKTDWWHRSDGTALYPRFELVDEFRRASGGKSLHIISFAKLLELFDVSPTVLEEVRREQAETERRRKQQRTRTAQEDLFQELLLRETLKSEALTDEAKRQKIIDEYLTKSASLKDFGKWPPSSIEAALSARIHPGGLTDEMLELLAKYRRLVGEETVPLSEFGNVLRRRLKPEDEKKEDDEKE